ncbi:PAS domain S-box protein [Mangrovibacillus cuniculi]|uniref:histidine kinase n=1 Tax=Mangrovibacillus cuniculi TaxID=2593652 RepID=A0A7S8HEN3_9BACI|nr:PAS domain S-box protein [Mangrovibacillus cuniculi]QPC45666.1 PAS domain S-box protein [Mangrovibacillus cuniculi]
MIDEFLHQNPFESDDTIEVILTRLVGYLSEIFTEATVTTMIYDESSQTLNPGPGYEAFPNSYTKVASNLPLRMGGCGVAVAEKRVVIVEDTHKSEIWKPFVVHSDKVGVRAVWSVPIIFRDKIYGTFAIYHFAPYTPTELDIKLTILMSKQAITAISYVKQKELESMYTIIANKSKDIITITLSDGSLSYINPAAKKILGYSLEEVMGNNFDRFIYPEDREIVKEYRDKILQSDSNSSVEFRAFTKKGTLTWLETTSTAIYNKNGKLTQVVSTTRDIQERKFSEKALLHSEKLTTVGQIAAGIAHEIRNPLTSLKGFLQLLDAKNDITREYISIMSNELSHIELISNEMLILAKPQAKHFVYANLLEILESVLVLLDNQAILHNVEIKRNITCSPVVFCVPNELRQVFVNLIKNAMESMNKSGGSILINVQQTASLVTVEIVDSGEGITSEKLVQLGTPFYTTKEKGTGLGLLVTYKIIDQHNGSLVYESEVNVGTTARVTLPLHHQ